MRPSSTSPGSEPWLSGLWPSGDRGVLAATAHRATMPKRRGARGGHAVVVTRLLLVARSAPLPPRLLRPDSRQTSVFRARRARERPRARHPCRTTAFHRHGVPAPTTALAQRRPPPIRRFRSLDPAWFVVARAAMPAAARFVAVSGSGHVAQARRAEGEAAPAHAGAVAGSVPCAENGRSARTRS